MSDQAFYLANPRKVSGGFSCDLVEAADGCAVARVTKRYFERPVFRFSSSRSEVRFDAYCNAESRWETFNAMATHLDEKWRRYP